MMSVEEYREIVGSDADGMSDKEIRRQLADIKAFCDMVVRSVADGTAENFNRLLEEERRGA